MFAIKPSVFPPRVSLVRGILATVVYFFATTAFCCRGQSSPSPSGAAPLPAPEPLEKLSDASLLDRLESANLPVDWGVNEKPHREAILNEILRRGKPDHVVYLRKKLWRDRRKLPIAKARLTKMETDGVPWKDRQPTHLLVDRLTKQLDVLTTLRRMENHPDPLTVQLRDPQLPVQGETRNLPTLKVSLKNQDINGQSFQLMFGGNYRSGRHRRWRVHVWDRDGNPLPMKESSGTFIGGGLFSENDLHPGETWDLDLPLDDYVKITQPGQYTARILYHNVVPIVDLDTKTLSDMIVSRSVRFPLQISQSAKTRIELTKKQWEHAREQIKLLSDDNVVRIVLAKYDESHHRYLSPNSPAGQLLSMQWQAVPPMIEAVQDETLSFHTRGWLLLLLFSITLEETLDPINTRAEFADILPSYRYKTPGGNGSNWKGKQSGDLPAQKRFARLWQTFAQEQLDVVVAP